MTSCIYWIRQDFRLHDNPALVNALDNFDHVYPVFILDNVNSEEWARGGASKVWLHHALKDLENSFGGNIALYEGDAKDIIADLVSKLDIEAVYWNRCYEPWRIARDKIIKKTLSESDIKAESFNASLLWEPHQISKDDGTPYKVFTPFYKKGCLGYGEPDAPLPSPETFKDKIKKADGGKTLEDLKLLPEINWHTTIEESWDISEEGALNRFDHFMEHGINGYKSDRNRPDLDNVSMLSPYLHHGQISPRTIWTRVRQVQSQGDIPDKDADHFLSELGWREFSYSLLYHFPKLTHHPLQEKFLDFPWGDNEKHLAAWQKGQTGFPIIDAGMRQLWATGWMHNRVRMIVGSFLVKNLLLHWHHGEKWFWDCLVDADLANNSASWQWIAGCGADAAPYFRIFNPMTQSEKFDPEGNYIRQWVPELSKLNNKHIHTPWDAPDYALEQAGIKLGKDYPKPIVSHSETREKALEAFQKIKKSA